MAMSDAYDGAAHHPSQWLATSALKRQLRLCVHAPDAEFFFAFSNPPPNGAMGRTDGKNAVASAPFSLDGTTELHALVEERLEVGSISL